MADGRGATSARWRFGLVGIALTLAAFLWGMVAPRSALAATFIIPAGNVEALIAAINAANGTEEEDTIILEAGTYTLTTVDNDTDGPNGLPSITSSMTILGAGANDTVIERKASAPAFRILHVAAQGILTLSSLSLSGGQADGSGGLFNIGTVTISESVIAGNIGGGLANGSSAILTVTGSIIVNNSGRGLHNDGLATLHHSTIIGNVGGGIFNGYAATVMITDSTIADNIGDNGGGIANFAGLVILTSTTVTRNAANGVGGGLINAGDFSHICNGVRQQIPCIGTVSIKNSTITENTAASGGGLALEYGLDIGSGPSEFTNTIVAQNSATSGVGPDCVGPFTYLLVSLGHNIVGNTMNCPFIEQESDLTGDPGLGAFTDDGTPGHGHVPLLSGSRAVDAGDEGACLPTDQLGQPRVGPCDIGAVEFPEPISPLNDRVSFEPLRPTFSFTADPAGCPDGFVGKFSFAARLTNHQEQPLTDLFVSVTTLTHNNLLLNAEGPPFGVGARLTVPTGDDFSDGVLSHEEAVDVPFVICLKERRRFTFEVDVFGVVGSGAATVAGTRRMERQGVGE
jgi:hypothetical protein